MPVGAHQERAVVPELPDRRPFAIDVVVFASRADEEDGEGDPKHVDGLVGAAAQSPLTAPLQLSDKIATHPKIRWS